MTADSTRSRSGTVDFSFLGNRLVRKATRRLRKYLFSRKTRPFIHRAARGLKFRLVPGEYIDREIYVEGIFEIYELHFAKRFGGGVLLDIGANIGNHALFLSQNFTETHCFEPDPTIAARLRENAGLNRIPLHIHEVGLGDADALCPFAPGTGGNRGQGSFVRSGAETPLTLPVRIGDDYLAERGIRDIALIKIDVEGAELAVLRGLQRTIREFAPPIILEFDGTANPAEPLQQLLDGYSLFEIDAKGRLRPFSGQRRMYNALFARPPLQRG